MAKSNHSILEKNKYHISPLDWSKEARVPNRALWEIAAIAGDVEPTVEKVKEKKEADSEWEVQYEKRVRAMKTAMLPRRGHSADHVYYDPQLGGNAALILNPRKFRHVRVEVASAIEFLWKRFGKDVFPEGLQVVHQQLSRQGAGTTSQVSQELPRSPIASTEKAGAEKGPSHRDQKQANATKELKRLQVLLYIFSRELYGFSKDSEHSAETVISDWLDSIEKAGLKGREGFGRDGLQTLIDKCFKSYSELKRNP